MRKLEDDEQDTPKVAMLLNIDHFYGESEGRLGPTLIFLCIGFAPLLIYGYYGLYFLLPIYIFAPIQVIWLIRWAMIILGDEKTRLANFKKQLNDVYASTYEMLRVRTIHPDGCIEYINGEVCYMVVTYNTTYDDDVKRSMLVRKFQSLMIEDRSYDINVQNITEMSTLENRYSKVQLFSDPEAAQDFIDIIDHNRSIVQSSSLLTRTIYRIKGRRSEWKEMYASIDAALKSTSVKVFKEAHLVTSREEIEMLLARDINGFVNIDEMLMKKYCDKQYYGSKVVGYDEFDTVKPKKKETVKEGFHILYKED